MPVELSESRDNCYQCMRPASTCICSRLNPLQTRTRFVVLMHPKEYRKERIGTGRITKLQLENSELIVGVDFTQNERINEILSDEQNRSFLLYPSIDSFNLSVAASTETKAFWGVRPYLFILDGTWPCARKMLKKSKNLQKLKRVSFDNEITSKFIIKQQPAPLCLSTIESVYTVINLLRRLDVEQSDTQDFLTPFEKLIEYQLDYKLNPSSKHYRSTESKEVLPKNLYKKNGDMNILRE